MALATDLPLRAQRLLAAGDSDGYRELFGLLEAVEDPHRRYWASASLIEWGLAAGASTSPTRLPQLLAVLAEGAVESLEREPCEPRLLNYGGVILYELWSLEAAQAMFEAARRLDPQLEEIERNLTAVAMRRRAIGGSGRRPPLHRALPDLERRASEAAARAQPAEGLKLSLCMIVRDEEEMLPRCLEAVSDAVDEVVIVDTGSTDATVEIARSFGARVISHPWTGSFAEARNVSFDAAGGDWLMYLDADEVLVREDAALLRSLTGRTWREAFYLAETNYTGERDDGTAVTHNAMRIFRNRPEYRFEGRVHEQIADRLPAFLPERLETTGVRIEHYGYLGAVRDRREKSRRNIELLRLQQAEGPATAFLHYNLGSEYAAVEDAPAALAEFERSWALLDTLPDRDGVEFVPALIRRLVKALRVCGRPAEAIARAEEGLERFPGFTDLVLEQALANIALSEGDRAIELFERCIEMGDAPRRYSATVGSGTRLPRVFLAETLLAQGRHTEAAAVAAELSSDDPLAVGLLAGVLEALLRVQSFAVFEGLVGLLERTPLPTRERRELLAGMYLRCGYAASAAEEWMAVCREEPDARALVGLARVAASRGMPGEAGEFAAAALSHDPDNGAAASLLSEAQAAA